MAKNPENIESLARINYASIPEAVAAWENDRQGKAVFRFLADTYNISDVPAILEEAGMETYFQYKRAGYLVGLVAFQIPKPNFYFLSNAIILDRLSRQGIPAALMIFEFPEDRFLTINHDKKDAFGRQEFYLGERQSAKINLRPDRLRDQPVRLGSLDAASGYPCNQILVRAEQAQGPANLAYPDPADALGIDIPQSLPLTDYYRILWQQTISRLNLQVPVFHVNMVQLYSTIAKYSPVFNYQARMLTSGEYYPFQVAWPDLYLECSSHASADFIESVSRAQQKRYQAGLPEVQVRLPHELVPELENLLLHPTGQIVNFNLNPKWSELESQIRELAKRMPKLPPELEAERAIIEDQIKQLKKQKGAEYQVKGLAAKIPRLSPSEKQQKAELAAEIKQLRSGQDSLSLQSRDYIQQFSLALPPAVEQVYNNLLSGVTYAL